MTSTCCWLCYHFQATCWAWRTGREFVDGAELDWAGGVRDAARAAQVFGFSGTAIKPQDKKFINISNAMNTCIELST